MRNQSSQGFWDVAAYISSARSICLRLGRQPVKKVDYSCKSLQLYTSPTISFPLIFSRSLFLSVSRIHFQFLGRDSLFTISLLSWSRNFQANVLCFVRRFLSTNLPSVCWKSFPSSTFLLFNCFVSSPHTPLPPLSGSSSCLIPYSRLLLLQTLVFLLPRSDPPLALLLPSSCSLSCLALPLRTWTSHMAYWFLKARTSRPTANVEPANLRTEKHMSVYVSWLIQYLQSAWIALKTTALPLIFTWCGND